MKKFLSLIITSVIIILALQSCKSSQDCPAYGRVTDNNIEQKV